MIARAMRTSFDVQLEFGSARSRLSFTPLVESAKYASDARHAPALLNGVVLANVGPAILPGGDVGCLMFSEQAAINNAIAIVGRV
jgi:hypothetical protein